MPNAIQALLPTPTETISGYIYISLDLVANPVIMVRELLKYLCLYVTFLVFFLHFPIHPDDYWREKLNFCSFLSF